MGRKLGEVFSESVDWSRRLGRNRNLWEFEEPSVNFEGGVNWDQIRWKLVRTEKRNWRIKIVMEAGVGLAKKLLTRM